MRILSGVFTRQERLALGFLVGVGLAGVGFQWLRLERPAPHPFVVQAAVAVNHASAAELTALPGIGPALAGRIVAHRKQHGRFLTLSDLSQVKGLTPKTLEKLKGLLRFD